MPVSCKHALLLLTLLALALLSAMCIMPKPRDGAGAAIGFKSSLTISGWNCNGLGPDFANGSSSKTDAVMDGGTDIGCWVETHDKVGESTHLWLSSDPAPATDSYSGAAISLSPAARRCLRTWGAIGSRLVWARLHTTTGNLLVVSHYIAHMFRENPSREDCFQVLEKMHNST